MHRAIYSIGRILNHQHSMKSRGKEFCYDIAARQSSSIVVNIIQFSLSIYDLFFDRNVSLSLISPPTAKQNNQAELNDILMHVQLTRPISITRWLIVDASDLFQEFLFPSRFNMTVETNWNEQLVSIHR